LSAPIARHFCSAPRSPERAARLECVNIPLVINNSGSVFGRSAGISAYTKYGGTTIINSGKITAKSLFAIDVKGAAATIYNSGTVTGFVSLTNNDDAFINQNHVCGSPSSRAISAMARISCRTWWAARCRPRPIQA
jgi:hypothetical protein